MVISFLLVSLNMDAILGEITLTRRRKKLDEMTNGDGLGGAYTETLSRIQAQPGSRSKLGMQVLMWVSHAERPLHVDELCHAFGVEGSTDLDIQNIPAIETLLACSLGLVAVEESSSTVRLVHSTLQEYLSNNTSLFPNPHSIIAEVCLTYLNFPHVRDISPTLRSVPQTAPFVEYASCYWGVHARSETTESVKTLALRLLDGYDKHISSKLLLLHSVRAEEQPFDRDDTPRGFTGLHGAAYFGCVGIIIALLGANKGDMGATDFRGNVAIAWASRRGHERVVRVLLAWSYVNSNTPGSDYGSAPLLWAAENSDPKRPVQTIVQTIVRTMGQQSGQSGRGFQKPGSVRPKPGKPADAQAKPTDAQAKPIDVLAKPPDAQGKPADAQAKPADAQVKPPDAQAKPADAQVKPPDAQVKSPDAQAKPINPG